MSSRRLHDPLHLLINFLIVRAIEYYDSAIFGRTIIKKIVDKIAIS